MIQILYNLLVDILKIDNEPVTIVNEILSDKQTSDLFLSPQVLTSIMQIIGVYHLIIFCRNDV